MQQRLALLTQAEVISQHAYDGCIKVLTIIDTELKLPHDNEQYQMAITHLARAADRVWQHEPVAEGLDQDVLEEVVTDADYPKVLDLHHQVLQAMGLIELPASEESFMIANIYSLFQLSLEEQQP